LPNESFIDTEEEKISYLRGAFLASGSINNPRTSGYHLEFSSSLKKDGIYLSNLLKDFNITSKVIKRNNKYMTYIKSSEMISDLIKMFGATNSLFYFEDIRIYRDHKNMVNRLNNCEIANQEKVFKAGQVQLENIKYLRDRDLFDLLDEKTRIVAEAREKYPESSFQELADIITQEVDYRIGKSGINHHFIKINELVKKDKEKKESDINGS
jgi:DNA-binding protein WhiA